MYKRPIYQRTQNSLFFNSYALANTQTQSCPWRSLNSPKKPQLDSLKQALKTSLAEPPDIQRRHLASEFSTMKVKMNG